MVFKDLYTTEARGKRIILPHKILQNDVHLPRKISDKWLSLLTKEDIVYIPLYKGGSSFSCMDRRKDFDYNLSMLYEIAPLVKAIGTGNAGFELTFRDYDRENNIAWCCDFIRDHTFVENQVWCPMNSDVAMDCYGDRKMLTLLKSLDSFILCFCGWWMFDGLPEVKEEAPWTIMRDYLSQIDVYSGVGFQEGLDEGRDKVLEELGFKAGILGYF